MARSLVVTPIVWIGGLCGEVTDALPGTRQHDESSCECSDECVSVACEASEFDVGEDVEDADDPRDADEERVLALEAEHGNASLEGHWGPKNLIFGWKWDKLTRESGS